MTRRMVKYEDVLIKKLMSYPEKDSFLAPVQQQNHAIGRNVSVTEVLCYVNLLQHDGRVHRNAIVDVPYDPKRPDETRNRIGAAFHDQHGKREWPACHVLPCNIRIFGTQLVDLPSFARVQYWMKKPFSKTSLMPRVANYADSLAEMNGLADAFVNACQTLIRDGRTGQGIDTKTIEQVYSGVYVLEATKAFKKASERIGEITLLGREEVNGHTVISLDSHPTVADYNRMNARDLLRNHAEYVVRFRPIELQPARMTELAEEYDRLKSAPLTVSGTS